MNARARAQAIRLPPRRHSLNVPHCDTSEAPVRENAQMPPLTFFSADILPLGESHSPARRLKDGLVPLTTVKRLPAAMLSRNMCAHAPACSHAGGGGAVMGSGPHPLQMIPDDLEALLSRTRLRV